MLCGQNICMEHFSSYALSLSAVEMSECFGRSAPSVTWLRPAWVSPCLDKARSLLPPHSLRWEQVLRPRAGDQLPCQQRPSKRGRSRRTQLPPVNTRSSQRHQSGILRCCAFFSAWNYFPPRTPGFPLFVVTTLSRPGKGLQDGKKTCFNIYFSSNFQSRFSSKKQFTYFGEDYII